MRKRTNLVVATVLGVVVAWVAGAACSSFASDADTTADAAPDGPALTDALSDASDAAPKVDGSQPLPPIVLATGYELLTAISATDTTVYFADGVTGSIYEVPLSGGSPVARYNAQAPTSLVAKNDGTIYFAEFGPSALGAVAPDAAPFTRSTFENRRPVGIALGASTTIPAGDRVVVALLGDAGPQVTSSIQQYDGTLAFLTTTTVVPANAFDVAVRGADIYWTNSSAGAIVKGAIDATTETTLVTGESDCQSLAVDQEGVYWARPQNRSIRMWLPMAAGGAGAVKPLASNEQDPRSVSADESGVYWMTSDGKIRRSRRNETPLETIGQGFKSAFVNLYSRTVALTTNYVVWITSDGKVLRAAK